MPQQAEGDTGQYAAVPQQAEGTPASTRRCRSSTGNGTPSSTRAPTTRSTRKASTRATSTGRGSSRTPCGGYDQYGYPQQQGDYTAYGQGQYTNAPYDAATPQYDPHAQYDPNAQYGTADQYGNAPYDATAQYDPNAQYGAGQYGDQRPYDPQNPGQNPNHAPGPGENPDENPAPGQNPWPTGNASRGESE